MRDTEPALETRSSVTLRVDGDAVVLEGADALAVLGRTFATGESLTAFVHPDDSDLFAWGLRAAPQRQGREATLRLRWVRDEGRWSRLLATFKATDSRSVSLTLEHDDVGSARRAEKQMRRVIEGSAQGIVVRTATHVLYMNDSFAKLLGYASPRECIDNESHIDSIIHPDDRQLVLDHLKARISGSEKVSHYDFRLLQRDRSLVWVETYAAMVLWNGQPASLSWLSDITARKDLEAALRRSKEKAEFASRSKTEFLANMSHELRTPLNAILGFSEVMAHKMFGPIDAKYAEYAQDIHHSGTHLLELINDVLDLSKLEAGKLELHERDVDLDAVVAEVVALLRNRAAKAKIDLTIETPGTGLVLRADQRSLKQVLLNFLSNALKFTPQAGAVRVAAHCDPTGRICVSVTDSGIGMTAAEIEVALSPFGQVDSHLARKKEGTGLGLPICKSLLQLHGGKLVVRSEPNCGTTLTARFPAERTVSPARTTSIAG